MKHRYALKFPALEGRGKTQTFREDRLNAPPRLQAEMERLVEFKTATLTRLGFRRNGVWSEETSSQRIEHLGLMFGALSAARDGPVAGFGLPLDKLTFALLVFPSVWDWYLRWRSQRRGFFTVWEVDMLHNAIALARPETGWLRQSPELAGELCTVDPLVSREDVAAARMDWAATCDRFCAYALPRAKEVARVVRVHRDPFEPILPILEADSPLGEYRKITEEILRRMPDARRYPRAAAEVVRAFLMLRLGLHLGLRQRNLRELLICEPGRLPRTERELADQRRGELRWNEAAVAWEVLIPNVAFKNGRSSFFAGRPFRLTLPKLGFLYENLDSYIHVHRRRLLNGARDPGTLFVKTVKRTSSDPSYDKSTFYETWRLAIERYGIWNPYTGRGAIPGLLPHGPHSVRDVIATHVLKQTGSYEKASYAIQDTPEMVAKHYGRFLPQDKATLAAEVLNRAWL
jgi:integrase